MYIYPIEIMFMPSGPEEKSGTQYEENQQHNY